MVFVSDVHTCIRIFKEYVRIQSEFATELSVAFLI